VQALVRARSGPSETDFRRLARVAIRGKGGAQDSFETRRLSIRVHQVSVRAQERADTVIDALGGFAIVTERTRNDCLDYRKGVLPPMLKLAHQQLDVLLLAGAVGTA
jgi:hypothetical protein